jgi:hypothetical protein
VKISSNRMTNSSAVSICTFFLYACYGCHCRETLVLMYLRDWSCFLKSEIGNFTSHTDDRRTHQSPSA